MWVGERDENLKELQVLESKWGLMRADLARKLLEEQDTVFRRYYETKWGNEDGGTGRVNAGRQKHVGRDVYIVIGILVRRVVLESASG